jgi:hypothetical protein
MFVHPHLDHAIVVDTDVLFLHGKVTHFRGQLLESSKRLANQMKIIRKGDMFYIR